MEILALDALFMRPNARTVIDIQRCVEKGWLVFGHDEMLRCSWSEEQQSRLIESMLMRIPIQPIYGHTDLEGRTHIGDGVERIGSILRFLRGELALKLPTRPELEGKTIGHLPPKLQNRFEDTTLTIYSIDNPKIREDVREDIFKRVGGGS